MKEKTVQLDRFDGIRNTTDTERLSARDFSSAENVDLDPTGKPTRRLGATLRTICAPKCLWSDGSRAYFLDGTSLKTFTPPSAVATLRTGLSANQRVAYAQMNGTVYYSNGLVTGKVEQGVHGVWGIETPALPGAIPMLGALPAGRYGYTMTFVRANGQEGGARRMQSIQLGVVGGISMSNIAVSTDATVTSKRVYITGTDGTKPFLVGTIPNAQTTFNYTHNVGGSVMVDTMFKGVLPAGHLLGAFNARIVVARGRYLWFSDPYAPERTDLNKGYLPLSDEPTILAPVESGIYVATRGQTFFLRGTSPEDLVAQEIAPYGAPLGEAVEVSGGMVTDKGIPGTVVGWMSDRGFVVGDKAGNLTNLTERRYVLPETERVATTFKQRGGLTQFISVLFN